MPDTFPTDKRSDIMRRVKSSNTKPELKVRSALHQRGLRYRLNYPLPGRPDIVFVRARVAVFIDSCFWHGCPQHLRMPKSNRQYWTAKIQRNIERDAQVNAEYKHSSWRQLRFWEHDLKEDFDLCIARIEGVVREQLAHLPHFVPAIEMSAP
jgi:DNA mismatch endonuclease (patch repair protein)